MVTSISALQMDYCEKNNRNIYITLRTTLWYDCPEGVAAFNSDVIALGSHLQFLQEKLVKRIQDQGAQKERLK